MEWTENSRRVDRACEGCGTPTRGRVDKKPLCFDCGLKVVMEPVRQVANLIRGLR